MDVLEADETSDSDDFFGGVNIPTTEREISNHTSLPVPELLWLQALIGSPTPSDQQSLMTIGKDTSNQEDSLANPHTDDAPSDYAASRFPVAPDIAPTTTEDAPRARQASTAVIQHVLDSFSAPIPETDTSICTQS
ncbi:hypothetical protein MMC13_000003 [Lambiella insularis]|nr:hypothetical protein [Lambiella insularis]